MIVSTPGTLGGKPRIEGRRIGVAHVAYWHHEQGRSVEAIAADYHLTCEQVQAALDYYAAHEEDIDARTRDDEAWIEGLRHAT